MLTDIARARIDSHSQVWTKNNFVNRWMGLRLDLIGALLFASTSWACVLYQHFNNHILSGGLVGLALASIAAITPQLNWAVRSLADAENAATSAERLLFLTSVASEAALVVPEHRPPAEWPTQGEIAFENVDLSYRPGLPLTLKKLTLTIPVAAKRIGIVGRTGCGKSTLFKVLFRIVEPTAGTIRIDGVDILQLGLQDLRSRLTMLPQEPVLGWSCVRAM
jgi:ABC-type multidrug transport system fused ATPase/permease subunit